MSDPLTRPPEVVRSIFAERRVFNERGDSVELGSNVLAEETALLHAAVRELHPAVSVEVGFAQGISTLAILDAIRANGLGHHHVIDPFQQKYENAGRTMIARAGLAEHYTFHERFAEDVIPGLPALQFAFIDSSHLFDLTVSEFVLVDRKLAVGGVVGFHDLWMPSLQAFMRYVLANRTYAPWQPAGWPTTAGRGRSGWIGAVRRALGRLPAAERIFAPDFLQPWNDFRLSNLVLLQKKDHDQRDWRFHQRF